MHTTSIEQHPDLLAMRARYGRAAESATVQLTLGLTLLTALYVALSPWVIGFDGSSRLAVIDLITGAATAALALGFSSVLDRTHGLVWTLPVLGAWTIIAPWVHTGANPDASMVWSNVVAGAGIVVLGLAAAAVSARAAIESH
ncbi:SPW repeat protein [Mycolicibacterium sp.]|uniref:SPW repeat protein n=1 Tax=Mycolicibacterium sp. TaxID=2320850 RepID=UPI0037CA2892